MTDKLPPNLLMLFAPRPPIRYLPPIDHAPAERKTMPIDGLVSFLPALQEYKETDKYEGTESWLQRKDRLKQERLAAAEALKTATGMYFLGEVVVNPNDDPNIRGDAFKTLIVARLSYEATEQDIEHEFSRYGPIERIRLVKDTHADEKPGKKKKPHRGYAFVVFERERDMRAALDACDGMRLKGRAIKVDVERGRTIKGWKPRRLGGGLGGRNYTRAMPSRPMGGGGFRGSGGGFRGGFDSGRSRPGGGGGGGGGGGAGGFRGGFRGSGFRGDRNGGPPTGPSSDRNGFGGRDRGDRGFDSRGGGGRSFDDRHGGRDREPRRSGSNAEPVRPRDSGYRDRGDRDRGDRDRDRDRGDRDRGDWDRGDRERDRERDRGDRERDRDYDRARDDDRKRRYEEPSSYDEPRKLRRY
ncbi:hypothetical protein TD95_005114 [Thielaviopsis punctulata]|uniref:RRM domain-containing protein n=1 Tax=Thielaviopsis punctulata TaxID=72032 RepID=A0A0F4ZHP4_9PEZI|nr:hypothetical protein TD95_005114 [Thielaviopsis punctulata]